MQGRNPQANLPEGNSILPVTGIAEASLTEEPGAGKPHAGICAGASGNRRPYRDGINEQSSAPCESEN